MSGDSVHVNVEGGKGYIKIPTTSEGLFSYKGVIKYKTPSGEFNYYPFTTEYQVAKPSTTISATAMNVFYIGVPNPVDISAPGVPKDKIRPSINNGSISKASGGAWTVNVTKPGKAMVSVSAEVDGVSKRMGNMEFRVKRIPNPIGKIGGKVGGKVRKAQLMGAARIQADLENFEFDVEATVVSYEVLYMKKGNLASLKVKGFRLNDAVKNIIRSSKPGANLFFSEIRAKLPDGTTRPLPTISFKLI